ncbi:MAG: hypothetical protein WAU75_20470 [Solirubrobacteraceae bacterium]
MADQSDSATGSTPEPPVTDADIDAIFERSPAGVADLMLAYDPVAASYFASVRAPEVSVTYAIDTVRR